MVIDKAGTIPSMSTIETVCLEFNKESLIKSLLEVDRLMKNEDGKMCHGQEDHPSHSTKKSYGVEGMNNQNDPRQSPEESHKQRQDFDDGANDLWSVYGKEAQIYDESRIKTLRGDMGGVLIFAGLFSAVLTAFVVPKIQDLKLNPEDQSAYYQKQSVHILFQLSQQITSVGGQISSPLSAAFLATLVQQWSKAYMHIFQQANNPLQIARFRVFLFEGSERLPVLAEVVLGLIHISLILFFLGLGDLILQIDTAIFVIILIPITVCVCLYLYCIIAPIRNPQSPYRTPFSSFIWFLIQKLSRSPRYSHSYGKRVKPTSIEKHQEESSMEETESRMNRDVRAIRWLVDRTNGSDEMQALALAIPGSFNGKWGPEVWKEVVSDQSTSLANPQARPHPGSSSAREGTTVYELCRRVRYFFETCKDEGNFMDTGIGRRRMRGYVETAASLVCCTGVDLGLFGEVGEVLSEVGDKEETNNPLKIRSSPSFAVRLTCLSLVAIRKMVDDNGLQELAKFALDEIAHLQTDYGYHQDTMALMVIAQRIDDYLTRAWASVVDLRQAFESWSLNRTESDIKRVLDSHRESISELEHIAIEARGVQEVDWHFDLLLETMDETTHKLMQRLPGVFFDKPKLARPFTISEAFDFPSVGTTRVPPQLISPGRQIQSLCTLGRKLRNIIEEQDNTESHEETLKSLLGSLPVSLRELNYLMKRQLWRLLDLRDGGGLGFTIELFFHVLRQLELSSTSSSSELKKNFYTGTFKAMTSDLENCKNSVGTQGILLDLLCDLVIRSRGAFSNFPYPPYIVEMLLELIGKMVKGYKGFHAHIDDIIQELEEVNFRNLMDNDLRYKALNVIGPPSST
ncbi:hypothetical protein F5888DRAFT_1809093 [Russula emetica]|nr:hypothetical protein F5888DRAFT_1809093 [Russula emetica]